MGHLSLSVGTAGVHKTGENVAYFRKRESLRIATRLLSVPRYVVMISIDWQSADINTIRVVKESS